MKAKWEGMKGALVNQNVEGAVNYYLSTSQGRYRDIFTTILTSLPSIASTMQKIELIYLEQNIAQYRIKRIEAVGEVTYYIYFAVDEEGIWKIQQF